MISMKDALEKMSIMQIKIDERQTAKLEYFKKKSKEKDPKSKVISRSAI